MIYGSNLLLDHASLYHRDYLQSPYLFVCCNLVHAEDPEGDIVAPAHRALAGTVVSSLSRLKDVDNSNGGFFVFGDVSVRMEGRFRLRFTLFELLEGRVSRLMSTVSNRLTVYSGKNFPGMLESTFLSRSFSDQGVRIRIRKDHHVKPKTASSMYEPKDRRATAFQSPPLSCQEECEFMSDNEHSVRDVNGIVKYLKTSPGVSTNAQGHSSSSRSEQHLKDQPDPPERWEWTPPSSPDSTVGCHATIGHPTTYASRYWRLQRPHSHLEQIQVDPPSSICSSPPSTMATSNYHGSSVDPRRYPSLSKRGSALYTSFGRRDQSPSFYSGRYRPEEPSRHTTGSRDHGHPNRQHPYRHMDYRTCHCACPSYDHQHPSHERGRRYTEGSSPLYCHDRIPPYPMGITQSCSTVPTRGFHHRHASKASISCDSSSMNRCAAQKFQVPPHTTPGHESYANISHTSSAPAFHL